jgi:hypothetical protein
MEDKARVIYELSQMLKATSRFKNLEDLTYHREDGQEFVLVAFKDGRTDMLCVSGETPEQMLKHVLKWLLYGDGDIQHRDKLKTFSKISNAAFGVVLTTFVAFFIVPEEIRKFILSVQLAALLTQMATTVYYLISSARRERHEVLVEVHKSNKKDGYIAIDTNPDKNDEDLGVKYGTFSSTEEETLKKAKKLVGETDEKMSKEEFEAKYKMEIAKCMRSETRL